MGYFMVVGGVFELVETLMVKGGGGWRVSDLINSNDNN